MRKKGLLPLILGFLLLTVFALSLVGCGEKATVQSETRTVYAMDTVMNLTVYGENAAAALESAEQELHTLDESVLSRTAEGSELYALNAANGENCAARSHRDIGGCTRDL